MLSKCIPKPTSYYPPPHFELPTHIHTSHAQYMKMTLHASIPTSILLLLPLLLCPTKVFSDDNVPIPPTKDQVNNWFTANVHPLASRKHLDPALAKAEANVSHIKVSSDGKGKFKTISDAINSVPAGNTQRVVISLAGGTYKERVKIERNKPFITLYGDPANRPTIVFDSTAAKDGTVYSATVYVLSDYFSAVNIDFVNTELHVIEGDNMAIVTAHGRHTNDEDTAYSFAHCKVTGKGTGGLLGRGWKPFSKVIISYTEIGNCIKPEGWSGMRGNPTNGGTTFFGEYKNTGPGSNMKMRPKFVRRLTAPEVRPYLTLGFVEASKWLLPPTKV
ncbi:unnamed protein product [Cuscuta epithymum]|uniref:pectinesterase n=1 Tax=Cuscuta epithymum TaxID=186058 RepID=A0AAV0DH79_9ASTE|nr:unnamed protein product [Cuscuta epithymum]